MDSVVRALVTYAFVWLIFRVTGKRTLSEVTTFDFVLLLIISETTQQAMVDDDNSMINAFLLIVTFFTADLVLSFLKGAVPTAEKIMDSTPVLIYANDQPIREAMNNERVDEEDVLNAARQTQGLERLDQVKYAVLECSGDISVVPKRPVDNG